MRIVEPARPVSAILLLTTLFSLMLAVSAGTVLPEIAAETAKVSVKDRALSLARAGRTEEAVQILQATLAAHPADLDARLALAEIYASNREGDKAEQEFHEALRLHPKSYSAELALGTFYINTGSLAAAEKLLEEAVRDHPKLTPARTQLALALARERKYAEAEANIRTVPPPTDPLTRVRFFRLVASIHSGLGDSLAAAHAMEEALHVMPKDEELQLVASVAEADAREWQSCIRNVAPLFRKHPTPQSGLVLLRAQLASHVDFLSTLRSLRTLSLPEGQELELRVRSAEMLASADKDEEAVEELQEALKIAGGNDETLRYNLAVEQYGAGQFDNALSTLESLRAQKDSAEVEDLIGDSQEQKGDFSSAVHSHQNAIDMAPQEERYRLSLGAELLAYKSYEPAALVFQKAAELFPNSVRIYVGLGMAYYFLEKYEDSVDAFLRADKLDGGSARAMSYLGATQAASPSGPLPAAINAICGRADSTAAEATAVSWCAALMLRKAYLAGNQSSAPDIIRRLRVAAKLAPGDPIANCSLGQALAWTDQLAAARHWLEVCVRLRPESAEDHYRLSRVYQGLGLKQAAAEQADMIDKANPQQDQQLEMAKKFAREMLGRSKGTKGVK